MEQKIIKRKQKNKVSPKPRKMKKIAALLILSASVSFGLNKVKAQSRVCGTTEHQSKLEEKYPEIIAVRQQIEQQTANFNFNQGQRATVTIPVVVHVIYNTTSQNISDAQVKSQIDVLNEDFRRLNADKVNTPSLFSGVASDCMINFCLAQKDPSGNATTGIVRKSTTTTSFIDDDRVKYSSTGGDNAWPSDKYLNLWVCNLGSSLLGYAQFPGGPAATDGVVVLYSAFGRTGTLSAPFNKGRTATHEVGHWLNLRHIWGDAACGNDLVSDTPTQADANYGCPTFPHKTCSNNGDMSMNYMDYTDDACMNMFSTGQASRMNALFASGGARYALAGSQACTAPSTTTTCSAPSTLSVSAIATTSATFGWTNTGAASYTIRYKKTTSTTWTNTTSTTISKSVTGLVAGTNYEFQVASVCSGSSSAYSASKTFTTTSSTTTSTSSTLTIGTGTSTSSVAPYGTYYMDERVQFIITKSELVAAGFTSVNKYLKSLAFKTATASTQTMYGFTIKVSHTTASSFATSSYLSGTGTTTVFSANAVAASNIWNKHNFSTTFAYNGTDNLLIDICWNNSTYTTNTTVYSTSTSSYRTLYKRSDLSTSGLCATSTGSLSYNRPNMQFVFGSTSTAAREFEQEANEEGVIGISTPKSSSISVYPNPVTDAVNIVYNVQEENAEVVTAVYTIYGALVKQELIANASVGENDYRLNFNGDAALQNIPNGMYIISVEVNGERQTSKFILNR